MAVETLCLDPTTVKVHACGALKKAENKQIGHSRGGLTTKIHIVAVSDKAILSFSLSSGKANDSPEGMKLLFFTSSTGRKQFLLMTELCR